VRDHDHDLTGTFRKQYRRKRRWQGATWTPERLPADIDDGAWCRNCRTRHGFMTMGLQYEKRKSGWWLLWSCRRTGRVIREMRLG
jgi:hypothetical protein